MKAITSTKGAIELLEPTYRQFIGAVPSVVTFTGFCEARAGVGQIKVWAADLPEDVTQEDWAEFLNSDNTDETPMADLIEIFLAQFEPDEDPEEVPDREALEARAEELEIKFRKDISDEKLSERIAEAEAAA